MGLHARYVILQEREGLSEPSKSLTHTFTYHNTHKRPYLNTIWEKIKHEFSSIPRLSTTLKKAYPLLSSIKICAQALILGFTEANFK